MKRLKSSFLLFYLLSLSLALNAQINDSNKHSKRFALTNKIQINELNGKPISYFLNHKGIDINAKKFYNGALGISDDKIAKGIIDSVLTRNIETLPFYFFLFNQIVDLSNEQMIEVVSRRCVDFVVQNPCEFFAAFNQNGININVVKWTTYIGYSLKDKPSFQIFKKTIDDKLKANCSGVQDLSQSFLKEVRMCLLK
jgi:hypothetical protein